MLVGHRPKRLERRKNGELKTALSKFTTHPKHVLALHPYEERRVPEKRDSDTQHAPSRNRP